MARSNGLSKKGSQLKQLKNTIKQSGLSRIPSTGAFNSKNKNKSSISSKVKDPEYRQKKLAEIQASQNLFDSKTSKIKFPTTNQLARQTKNSSNSGSKNVLIKTVGKPTQSATQAHQRRVEKLLPEYLNRNKSSQFLDKRFGEGDSTLTPEEKALERFTIERQTRSKNARKNNVFNLDDDGEGLYDDGEFGDNAGLTHGGLGLNFDEDPDDNDIEPEDIFERRQDPGASGRSIEDLDEENSASKKTKAEVMSEIITKSKAHKYQRQLIKEKDDELRENLNEELNEIRSLLFTSEPSASTQSKKGASLNSGSTSASRNLNLSNLGSKPAQTESTCENDELSENSRNADPENHPTQQRDETANKDVSEQTSGSGIDRKLLETLIGSSSSPSSTASESEDEDVYDRLVRELAFESRAQPSDRMKTGEEAALEEAERLRELESQRLKRMRGDSDDDSDAEQSKKTSDKKRTRKKPEADDLEDDFFPLEDQPDMSWDLGQGLRPDGAFGGGLHTEQESEEETNNSTSSDLGDDDDTGDYSDFSNDDADPQEASKNIESLISNHPNSNKISKPSITKTELAYTYPCPSSHAEFLSILSSASVDSSDLPTVVKRIRVLYHSSLGEGNKEKLATFANVLVDHIIYLASQPLPPHASLFDAFNGLLPHLLELCRSYPQTAAAHFVTKLVLMQKNLTHALTHPNIKGWPGASELILLRLIGLIWSTSDFSHPVAAPALLLMNQYLNQLKVKEFSDLISGVFLCTLILQYETQSTRLVPEVINFLALSVLRMTCSREKISLLKKCMIPILEGPDLELFPIQGTKPSKLKPQTIDFTRVFGTSASKKGSNEPPSDQDLVDLIDVIFSLLKNFSDLYGSSSFYPEVFGSVLDVTDSICATNLAEETNIRISELRESIESKTAATNRIRALNPIKLQSHKPIPIKSQAPQFDPQFNPHQKKFNPDSAQVEINKLKNLVKKEKKGAIRELRKDNKFLAMAQAQEKDAANAEYKTKMARITASLQEERSEEKKQERLKLRLKKLDKAKRGK